MKRNVIYPDKVSSTPVQYSPHHGQLECGASAGLFRPVQGSRLVILLVFFIFVVVVIVIFFFFFVSPSSATMLQTNHVGAHAPVAFYSLHLSFSLSLSLSFFLSFPFSSPPSFFIFLFFFFALHLLRICSCLSDCFQQVASIIFFPVVLPSGLSYRSACNLLIPHQSFILLVMQISPILEIGSRSLLSFPNFFSLIIFSSSFLLFFSLSH